MGALNTVMSRSDLSLTLDWAADEGWNPGLCDAQPFHAADPKGFFSRRVDGVPVSAISVVNHSADFSFLGLYICRPEWRGQGHGMAIWRHALLHAGSRTVGLDGVAEQQANYQKSGFVLAGSTLRYEGTARPDASPGIRAVLPPDLAAIAGIDWEATGIRRPTFLNAWTTNSTTRKTLVLYCEAAIIGFATYRKCREGTKIGPIIAPDTKAALGLIGAVGALVPTHKLILDIPEANVALRRELEGLGYFVPFATARMYRGKVPCTSPRLQAIATMELG